MNTKLKVLSLGLLAMVAIGAFAAVNATAESGGHFVSAVEKTVVTATEEQGTSHHTELKVVGLEKGITCPHVLYDATAATTTVTSLTFTPTYPNNCVTAGTATKVPVDHNECGYTFSVKKKAVTSHSTVSITCPAGKSIVITHPECEITVPAQALNGVSYSNILENGVHTVTAELTIENISVSFHKGLCTLLGTAHLATFKGSVTARGFTDESTPTEPYKHSVNPVSITATSIE